MENEKPKGNAMEKLATLIVDKRNLIFLLYIFALIFCVIATGWVNVENDITTYLPDSTETRQGLTVMNDNFTTYGTARVMVSNITYDKAVQLEEQLEDIDGVDSIDFDETSDHYKDSSALFSVSFDGEVDDPRAEAAMDEIRAELADYDTSIYTEVGYDSSADLQSEMSVIIVIAAVIIVLVLTLTSRSYAEVPVLIMTFGAAALLNMGTNFLCGTISFISNSVTVILQLALAIDYAIILCHRFSDEHETLGVREACIAALSKAIPEISSSSLTTISGLAALAFMHFRHWPRSGHCADQGHPVQYAVGLYVDARPAGAVQQADRQDPPQEPGAQDHCRRQVRRQDPLHRAAHLCGGHHRGSCFCEPVPLLLHLH